MSRCLPPLVAQLCELHSAWVVGSAADETMDLSVVRDFDVMVPFTAWQQAAALVPKNARPNTFGGWKCKSAGRVVDVWPGELGELLTHNVTKYAWHPMSGTRILKAQQ